MNDKYDSNGDYPSYTENFKRKETSDNMKDVDDGENDESNSGSQKAGEYVRELMAEKILIDQNKHPNAARLLDQENAKAQILGRPPPRENKFVDIYREKPIKVTVKVLVPVREHPKFNFVGKLLGPKGNSMKRLQEETMCKMAVLGKGSMKDRQKEEECRKSLDPKYAHLTEDLHVEISALGPPAEAHARVAFALAEVRKYLIPDNNDNIRQEQMREMEIMTAGEGVEERDTRLETSYSTTTASCDENCHRAPVVTPRVMPAKTKILSILDRARIAMEESYGYDDDYAHTSPPYEYSSSIPHSRSYSSHHYEPEYETEYYRESSSYVACGSNSARDLVSFFRIPSEYDNHKQFNKLASERRKAWINRLKRADLTESKIKNGRICSKHFISVSIVK
ncbi:hypothetical protein NQ317_003225 [Molorchus minor]|uniref:K Homology domain-containing protein n=1 Tax=Molorchus minor TaxID=1323400 RepID=A0ABQ9JDW2_9CUCU|nr:hypothetical protein NQ317_003225 [Molorchus minor]